MNSHDHSQPSFFQFLLQRWLLGGWRYWSWMGILLLVMGLGLWRYADQWRYGLRVTGMSDQVMWGLYIGNFTFLVGIAAAAVVLMVPAFILRRPWMQQVTPLGECMAIAAVMMSLLFILVDLGQPLHFWHALPLLGALHFPASIMAWDIVVLGGYLCLNIGLLFHSLYGMFHGREPQPNRLFAWMVLAIFMGLSIHIITAFMLVGVPARPFWHTAVMAPRFIASAFAAGSGLMILAFQILHTTSRFRLSKSVVRDLALVMLFALLVQLFLLMSELFVHFYPIGGHGKSATYLYFGLSDARALTPWIRLAILAEVIATLILMVHVHGRGWRADLRLLNIACVLTVVGLWFEKGMGLIVPGFIPTPLGEIMEYMPTDVEIQVTLGIWAFGLFLFSLLARSVVAVQARAWHRNPNLNP